MHSVQFTVLDSNSPLIIWPKTSEHLNRLKRLSNINVFLFFLYVTSDIDFLLNILIVLEI